MQVYTVHTRPLSAEPDREIVLVKEGFNWSAALFSLVWALANGLWMAASLILVGGVAIELALSLSGADPLTAAAAALAYLLVIGYQGNGWLRATHEGRGWRMAGVSAAPDRDAALRRFLDLHPELFADWPAGGAAFQA